MLGGGANPQAYFIPESIEHDTLTRSHYPFDSTGETLNTQGLHLGNTWLEQNLDITLSQQATLWRYSIDTITGSEAGFERTHQGCSFTFLWSLVLGPQESWHGEIVLKGNPQASPEVLSTVDDQVRIVKDFGF